MKTKGFFQLKIIPNVLALSASFEYLCYSFSAGTVFIRQILTYKDGSRTGRIKKSLMVVDPYHMYSNESERAN